MELCLLMTWSHILPASEWSPSYGEVINRVVAKLKLAVSNFSKYFTLVSLNCSEKNKSKFSFSVSCQQWDGTDGRTRSIWTTVRLLWYIVSIIADAEDGLITLGAAASATMVCTHFPRNISVSAPEWLTFIYFLYFQCARNRVCIEEDMSLINKPKYK